MAKTEIVQGPLCLSCRKELKPNDKVHTHKEAITGKAVGFTCSKKCCNYVLKGFNEGPPVNPLKNKQKKLSELKVSSKGVLDELFRDYCGECSKEGTAAVTDKQFLALFVCWLKVQYFE